MKLYNGCPDSELRAKWDEEDKAGQELRRLNPETHCTYFPAEEEYSVWAGHKQISGDHQTRLAALKDAIEKIGQG